MQGNDLINSDIPDLQNDRANHICIYKTKLFFAVVGTTNSYVHAMQLVANKNIKINAKNINEAFELRSPTLGM